MPSATQPYLVRDSCGSPPPLGPSGLGFLVPKSFCSFSSGKLLLFMLCFAKILWLGTRGYFSPFKPGDFEREEEDRSSLRSAQQGALHEDPCCGDLVYSRYTKSAS